MTDNIPYGLIAAYLTGEADAKQRKELEEWKSLSERNRRVFNELMIQWGCSFADTASCMKSRQEVYRRVLRNSRMRRRLKPISKVATAAALIGLGFVMSLSVRKIDGFAQAETTLAEEEVRMATVSTLPGQKSSTVLPDGTVIWLNSGTEISYPLSYGEDKREVTLQKGEAFFEVAHDGKPFCLNISNGSIKVYGTQFNVKDYPDDDILSVVLQSGSIEHFSKEGTSTSVMHPGQALKFNKETGSITLADCDADNEALWRFGELKVVKENIRDMMLDMEKWYGVEIALDGHIVDSTFYWMTIKTESLREMLDLIDRITPIKYRIEGREVAVRVL